LFVTALLEDFKRNYFGTFLLEMFAFKVNIPLSEEQDNTLKGLSGFISRFADVTFIYNQYIHLLGIRIAKIFS
jgi:hypothetical protein